ncbi:MAG: hypothetical protein LDL33_00305 [Desulfomonile sp.]|nr:hypothetical protein [Desulfomonile sp.]
MANQTLSPLHRAGHKSSIEIGRAPSIQRIRGALGITNIRCPHFIESLPFSVGDTTAGSETELQAAVRGSRTTVDLPLSIEHSNYFSNIVRRAAADDNSGKAVTDLERYLENNEEGIWENSWVRFPSRRLSPYARQVFASDLLADRMRPDAGTRRDADRFLYTQDGEEYLRVPISYLIKLSLADVLGTQRNVPEMIVQTAHWVMDKLLSDNTSPETLSFHVTALRPETGSGRAIARETSRRYLLTQLLIMYANEIFGLKESGQEAMIYFSPHPPIRQRQLNEVISDSFYRELFMSPCLSGWDDGLAKHEYMCLCHQVLSRSALNAVAKLREARIITRNLVVIPTVSNTSLANNGTHLSLGSRRLTQLLGNGSSGLTAADEKWVGDLVIKIVEHFLPLFVGTYSAAPYRLDFSDFHPERVLGFLPHELDYTHLRMMWRRWKKKARLAICGQPVTPFGLKWLDRAISCVFRMKGDYIPDFRLIDYLVTPMSTPRSPALDGSLGNDARLKKDLADLGIFDAKMALYTLYRLREFSAVGYSGFEGRHYSLFDSIEDDVAAAADIQTLVTALAFKYVLSGAVSHSHIPDEPFTESERRQIFFGAAIGLPTFYVHGSTRNLFLRNIVQRTRHVRYSRRYPGYIRVYHRHFRLALARRLMTDAADLVEALNLDLSMQDLFRRLEEPNSAAVEGKLTRGILREAGLHSPMSAHTAEFNHAAEVYYRSTLKRRHIAEALEIIREDFKIIDSTACCMCLEARKAVRYAVGHGTMTQVLETISDSLLQEKTSAKALRTMIDLMLITINRQASETDKLLGDQKRDDKNYTSIHQAGNR